MTKEDHFLTRTYAGNGRMTLINDAQYTSRQRMYLDIVDIRKNFGTKYNQGMLDMIDYAKTLPQYAR